MSTTQSFTKTAVITPIKKEALQFTSSPEKAKSIIIGSITPNNFKGETPSTT